MILGLSNKTASELSAEFREGNIKKEYIARCKGEFPAFVAPSPLTILHVHSRFWMLRNSDEVTCNQPLLTVDRQMGLNIVHPDGKVR